MAEKGELMQHEIRRVPPGWEQPEAIPLHDETFEDAMERWIENWRKWQAGTHEDQLAMRNDTDGLLFHEWDGGPPDPAKYRASFTEEPTWFQLYLLTDGEGSTGYPVGPPFATEAEVVEHFRLHDMDGGRNGVPALRRSDHLDETGAWCTGCDAYEH